VNVRLDGGAIKWCSGVREVEDERIGGKMRGESDVRMANRAMDVMVGNVLCRPGNVGA